MANNGEEAVSMFKSFKEKPEIILMDHRMPIKNGFDASKEILQLKHDVKIIFATADKEIRKKAMSIGIFSLKDKPFEIDHLLNNINKAVNSLNQ